MRALIPLTLVALLPAGALAAPDALIIDEVRAADPPHCMAAGQWKEPSLNGPLDLFDGDPDQPWIVCPEAAAAGDYALDFSFAAPIRFDGVRIHPGPAGGNPARTIELGFHDRSLTSRWPIYFRQIDLEAGPSTLAFQGRLPWNPQLVNDVGFAERRRERKLSELDVPLPLTADKLTVVLRKVDASQPVQLGEITFLLAGQPVKVQKLAAARARHVTYLEQGLRHVLAKRFLVRDSAAVHLASSGELLAASGEAWRSGEWLEAAQPIGRWRLAAGRLEMQGKKDKDFSPVEYRVDEAPTRVELRSGPLKGEWKVVAGMPRAGDAPAKAPAATAAVEPAADAPAAIPIY